MSAEDTSLRASVRFSLRLACRFARSSALARSASIVFVAGTFLLAMFVTLETLTLSDSQVVERDLGRFGASVGYGTIVVPPGDDGIVEDLLRAAGNAGATDAMVLLSAADVQLATGGIGGGPREVTLQEAAWASRPFPDRYVLLEGRWPRRPGEIVVTDSEDVNAAPGAQLRPSGERPASGSSEPPTTATRGRRLCSPLPEPGTPCASGSPSGFLCCRPSRSCSGPATWTPRSWLPSPQSQWRAAARMRVWVLSRRRCPPVTGSRRPLASRGSAVPPPATRCRPCSCRYGRSCWPSGSATADSGGPRTSSSRWASAVRSGSRAFLWLPEPGACSPLAWERSPEVASGSRPEA